MEGKKTKIDRIDTYTFICKKAGLTPVKKTEGYFTKEQMIQLAAFISALTARIEAIDRVTLSLIATKVI